MPRSLGRRNSHSVPVGLCISLFQGHQDFIPQGKIGSYAVLGVQQKADYTWYQFQYRSNRTGWVPDKGFVNGVHKAVWVHVQDHGLTSLPAAFSAFGYYTDPGANVYDAASTMATVLGTLNIEQRYSLQARQGNWWQILFGDHTGWVRRSDVRTCGDVSALPEAGTVAPSPKPRLRVLESTTPYLNVRNDTSVDARILGTLLPGTERTILAQAQTVNYQWWQTQLNPDTTGWVAGHSLTQGSTPLVEV